jgi:hypothetical protein
MPPHLKKQRDQMKALLDAKSIGGK